MASPAQVTVDMEIPGATSLGFDGLEWRAAVSTPFLGRLDVTSTSPSLDMAGLLGTPVSVTVTGAQRRRQTFAGEIDGVEQLDTREGRTTYQLVLRPTVWRLALRSGSRVLTDMSALDVLALLLSEHDVGAASVRTQGAVDGVAHVVQYEQSDLAFVEGLLAGAGLHYFSRCSAAGDTLVVQDVTGAPRRRVGYVGNVLGAPGATAWTARAARGDGPKVTASGAVNVPGIEVGEPFDLDGHPRADQNAAHVPVSMVHRVVRDAAAKPSRSGVAAAFSAELVAVPFGTPLAVPTPTGTAVGPAGPQPAVVTGAAGERIDVDGQGRVRIRLGWGSTDDASLPAPVAQPAAGDGRGTTFWPRVGDRVLVEFEEGDLSRPVVLGSLYDDDCRPPVELPACRDETALVSDSSRIVLDDRPGHQQLSISTAGDQLSAVGGTHSTSVLLDDLTSVGGRLTSIVGADRSTETGGDTVTAAGGDVTTSIGGDRSVTVRGDSTESVDGRAAVSVGGERLVSVRGDDELTVDGELVIEAGRRLVLRCGDASITLRADGDVEVVGGGDVTLVAAGDLVLKGSRILD